MANEEKIYIGSGKSFRFDNGGGIVRITVDVDSILKYFDQYGFTTDQGKRKIKLNVTERREADSYGNTHAVTVDTWKPDGNRQSSGGSNFGGQSSGGFGSQQSGQSFGQSQPAQNKSFGGNSVPKFEGFGSQSGNDKGPEPFEDEIPF